MTARVGAKRGGEAMLPTRGVDNGFLGSDEVQHYPPLKKMRGTVTNKVVTAGLRKPTPEADAVAEKAQSWALVPYEPPIFPVSVSANKDAPGGRIPQPRPIAIRDCPPGMRIRGGRPILVNGKGPAGKKKLEKGKVDPIILSDSESEQEIHAVAPRHSGQFRGASSSRSFKDKVGTAKPALVSKKGKQGKTPVSDETIVKFEPTAPELKSGNPRVRVSYMLSKFDDLRRLYLADEEQRVKAAAHGSKRADLRASATLMHGGYNVNGPDSILGPVPGVEVGDHFYYRMELLMISLHRQSQAGIDYIAESKSTYRDQHGRSLSVAVSVIASGGYEDDKDDGDMLIYTGQGGNNYKGNKRQGIDQELCRGNLALKNSCELRLAVRVIRGCDLKKSPVHQSPSGRIYYYDGLYDVVASYQETGSSGFIVWKFRLIRQAGQGALSSRLVLFKGKSLPAARKERGERIISEDLSQGLEPKKVRVVGLHERDRVPDNFTYITNLRFAPGLPKRVPSRPCRCETQCIRRHACSCVALNRNAPYNNEGGLIRAKRLLYECGPLCQCRAAGKCTNRVSQKGLRYDLEVFNAQEKGWGVRSSYFIPPGSFICEYIGEVIHETDAENRVSNDEYLFDLNIPDKDSMQRRFGSGLVTKSGSTFDNDEDDESDDTVSDKYTLDANQFGNVARFINHSCKPNLFVQCVLYDHDDHRFPHVMLFTSKHISPYEELTYDYGYEMNKIKVNGTTKMKYCYCGAERCRGRLY